MSIALVYLLSLPLVFVYFLHIKLPWLKKEIVNEKQNQLPKRRHMFQKKMASFDWKKILKTLSRMD